MIGVPPMLAREPCVADPGSVDLALSLCLFQARGRSRDTPLAGNHKINTKACPETSIKLFLFIVD